MPWLLQKRLGNALVVAEEARRKADDEVGRLTDE